MNFSTIQCTEAIMEDNSTMHIEKAIIRKVMKVWEQLIARVLSKLRRSFTRNSSRSLTEKMHIKALSESTPKSRPVYHPNHNHLNDFYETQELGS